MMQNVKLYFLRTQVASHFTESLHHLRDVLVTQTHGNYSVSPGLGRSTISLSGHKKTSAITTTGDKIGLPLPGSDKTTTSSVHSSGAGVSGGGVSLQRIDQITGGLRELGSRVSQVLEIVSTLTQFQTLVTSLRGLPRVSGLWAPDPPLIANDDDSLDGVNERGIPIPEGSVKASDYLEQVFGRNEYPLSPLNNRQEILTVKKWSYVRTYTALI